MSQIVVSGHFRFPPERVGEANPAMAAIIAASRAEPGCRAYSFAEDVIEPGLFRVYEEWESRTALITHFATKHMSKWQEAREQLGFYDRAVTAHETEGRTSL